MVYIRIATTITFWSGIVFTNEGDEMIDSWTDGGTADPGSEVSNTWNEIVFHRT